MLHCIFGVAQCANPELALTAELALVSLTVQVSYCSEEYQGTTCQQLTAE